VISSFKEKYDAFLDSYTALYSIQPIIGRGFNLQTLSLLFTSLSLESMCCLDGITDELYDLVQDLKRIFPTEIPR